MKRLDELLRGSPLTTGLVLLMVALSVVSVVANVYFIDELGVPIFIAATIFSILGAVLGIYILRRRNSATGKGLAFYFVQILAIDSRYFGFDFYTSGSVDLNIWFNFGTSTLSIDVISLFMYVGLRRLGPSPSSTSETSQQSDRWDWAKYKLPFYLLVFGVIPLFSLLGLFTLFGPAKSAEGIPEIVFLVVFALFIRDLRLRSEKTRLPSANTIPKDESR